MTNHQPRPLGATFAEAVRNAMASRGLSQESLAAALGTRQSAVSEWLTRGRKPNVERVYQLEAVLELPTGSLARLLNYLPAEVDPRNSDEVVLGDPDLTAEQKQTILTLIQNYKAMNRTNQEMERLRATVDKPQPPRRKNREAPPSP